MKQYILSIAVSAVVSAIIGLITPAGWGKYIRVITGLVIALCIASPVMSLIKSDIFEDFSYVEDSGVRESGEDALRLELASELSRRIEYDIAERISSEFGRSNTAEVDISTDSDGNISGVNKITLYGDSITGAVRSRMREVYGTDEVVYGGSEKNTSKTE